MKDTPTSHLEIPEAWGWNYPSERVAQILFAQLQRTLSESELRSREIVAYHQDRDDVLLRRQDEPDTFIIIHLRQKLQAAHSRAVFEGTFSEFAAREQQRHEIERRMIESPNAIPGICPVCFAAVTDEGCGGIWSGSIRAKAASGPLHHAACKSCHSSLTACPTHEQSEAGIFIWEFDAWGDDGA